MDPRLEPFFLNTLLRHVGIKDFVTCGVKIKQVHSKAHPKEGRVVVVVVVMGSRRREETGAGVARLGGKSVPIWPNTACI